MLPVVENFEFEQEPGSRGTFTRVLPVAGLPLVLVLLNQSIRLSSRMPLFVVH